MALRKSPCVFVKIHNVYNYTNYHEFGKQGLSVSTCGAWALSPWVLDRGPRSLGLGGTLASLRQPWKDMSFL